MGDNKDNITPDVERYKKKIMDIVDNLEDEMFLRRIYIILRKHIEKRGS